MASASDSESEGNEGNENCGPDALSPHRAMFGPEAASTPRRDLIVQCLTPISLERPQQVIGPHTNLRPTADEPWGARLVTVIQPEGSRLAEGYDIQSTGVHGETPTFTCEIVFWHIQPGEEDDFNDTTDVQWCQDMRGSGW